MRQLLVVPVLVLALAGCSGAAQEAAPPAAQPSASASATATGESAEPQSQTGSEAEVSAEPTASPAAADQVLGSREGQLGREQVRADVVTLRRAGALVNLEVVLTNLGDNGAVDPAAFVGSDGGRSVTGITLVDGVGSQRYLPAQDSAGNCVCSSSRLSLAGGASTVISATYKAPPASVQVLSVELPGFGTFTDLPLAG